MPAAAVGRASSLVLPAAAAAVAAVVVVVVWLALLSVVVGLPVCVWALKAVVVGREASTSARTSVAA